jgi:predicted dehydrogenase
MSDTVTVALVGIAGYGKHFVESVLDHSGGLDIKCVAGIARRPQRCERLDELKAAGAEIFPDMDEFYAKTTADLVVISSPIQLHREQTCLALEHGSNVLCEKPVAGTIQDARVMAEVEKKTGKFAAIGFQWSFSRAIQALKKDIMDGVLGNPLRLKAMVLWPRDEAYYNRNDWAARLRTREGDWILDSPINNATAHFLHNMLYVLGSTREKSAVPVDIAAELYRANDIENFDTGILRCHTDSGVDILFYSTHAACGEVGPVIHYEFENADVYFDGFPVPGAEFVARFRDGTIKKYGSPSADDRKKFSDCVEAVRTGEPVACAVGASMPQVLCVNGMQDSVPEIADFPKDMVKVDGEPGTRQTWVQGLPDVFVQCYDQGILPSEHGGVSWAKCGKKIDLANYGDYPSL